MTPDINNLIAILSSGISIWILCIGALLCLLIDCIWPKKMTVVVYSMGILTLIFTLVAAWSQWESSELLANQNLLIMDMLTLFILCLIVLIGIITLFNAMGYIKLHQTLTSEFCSLLLFSIIGMVFLFTSNHLLVNFIGLETMSLAIYVLVGSHKKNFKSNEAAIKYFIIGGVASAILLYGIALFYGAFGTVQLTALANMLATPGLDYLPKIALSLILVGIFFKIAVVPFHFWAPDVYEGAPAPVTGFMATGVKVAAFGFALRVFMNLGVLEMPHIQNLLTVIVVITLVMANLVAISQDDVKRMLAYSSVSHAGFLLFGILAGFQNGKYDPQTSNALLFYLVGYVLMTLGAFAVISLMTKEKSEATNYGDLRGLGKKHPILAGIFTLFMISLIGIPGTVGFAAKFGIISLAVQNNHINMAILAVIMSIVSAFYYLRPSVVMFFSEDTGNHVIKDIPLPVTISITFCAFLVVYLGVNPDIFIKLSQIAASSLQN